MENEVRMYKLKPIVSLGDVAPPAPGPLYELKSILGRSDQVAEVAREVIAEEQLPELLALDARQKKILQQLEELKQQVTRLCEIVKLPAALAPTTKILNKLDPVNKEIIIHANPASPPYSLLGLHKFWKDVNFTFKIFKHSTISSADTSFFDVKIPNYNKINCKHHIHLTLIWKQVSDFQFITKVYDYNIEGEVNFLRYLSRVLKDKNYENASSNLALTVMDSALDLCQELVTDMTPKMFHNFLNFSKRFDKHPWLLNNTIPTIVDIAAWSVIKRSNNIKMPPDLKAWFDACESEFL